MKYLIAAMTLAGCATHPEPITDYNAPFLSGKGAGIPNARPEPRPKPPKVFFRNPDCNKKIGENCDEHEDDEVIEEAPPMMGPPGQGD